MKVYVLTVEDDDVFDVFSFSTKEKAVECIENDIYDHYHFDTDEPYLTNTELKEEICEMRESIKQFGTWNNAELVKYSIFETELN
jgi:hypothetical protein